MQKWRSMGAVSAASIALFCCHAFCTQWSSPLSYSNLPSGDPEDYMRKVKKKLSEKSNPKCSRSPLILWAFWFQQNAGVEG